MTDIDETTREDKILEFINDIDRFLEVSYVYRGRIEEAKTAVNETSYDRHKRLTELLNSLTPKDINKPPVVEISETEAKGRTVVPDKSTLSHTQHYLKLVQKRIDSPSYASPLLDSRHIKNLLAMPPKKFIGQFGSSSFAWDVLTELASLTFLPSPQNLTARDYIHMHTVELRQHFFRIAARAKILTSEVSLELKGRFRISELYSLEKSKLIERIVEESVHREARGLVDFLIGNFIELESLFEEEYQKQQFKKVLNILCERKEQIINEAIHTKNGVRRDPNSGAD